MKEIEVQIGDIVKGRGKDGKPLCVRVLTKHKSSLGGDWVSVDLPIFGHGYKVLCRNINMTRRGFVARSYV